MLNGTVLTHDREIAYQFKLSDRILCFSSQTLIFKPLAGNAAHCGKSRK
ncbi:hypothetical protein [Nostoc sp.]